MDIRDFFIKGDMKGAIEFMGSHEEFKDVLPLYMDIFENCKYLDYDVPTLLNDILRQYQIYFRDVFYCRIPAEEAGESLKERLVETIGLHDADEDQLTKELERLFEENGFHALFGDTQGYYGPYIWRETVPATYSVELPDTTAEYRVNILKGFLFRSWMDYLTFGKHGTGGWAGKDGVINCIEKAYDFDSDAFRISFLKHEAQHTVDMKNFPEITSAQLEYRAKLVELIYCSDTGLLQKFISEADDTQKNNGHAMASARIKKEFANINSGDVSQIHARASELFSASTKEITTPLTEAFSEEIITTSKTGGLYKP